MTEEELAALEQRYTAEPVPPCRVCGGELSVQSMGGGKATVYGCSNKPDDVKYTEWIDGHYRQSTWVQYRDGDADVLALVAAYRSAAGGDQMTPEPRPPCLYCGRKPASGTPWCTDCVTGLLTGGSQ